MREFLPKIKNYKIVYVGHSGEGGLIVFKIEAIINDKYFILILEDFERWHDYRYRSQITYDKHCENLSNLKYKPIGNDPNINEYIVKLCTNNCLTTITKFLERAYILTYTTTNLQNGFAFLFYSKNTFPRDIRLLIFNKIILF